MKRGTDAPLSAAERAAVRAETDESVDALSLELRRLAADRRPDARAVARVMDEVRRRRSSLWQRLFEAAVRPRHLRIDALRALPLAGLAALVLAATWILAASRPNPSTTPETLPSAAVLDVSVEPRIAVSFELPAPKARRVFVVGDFNDWNTTATAMADPDGDGIWSVTVGLRQGRYAYKFLVDGERWVIDPDAQAFRPDGFGGQNALLRL